LSVEVGGYISTDFDLIQVLSPDFKKLKRIMYEYDEESAPIPQGEAILDFLNMPQQVQVRSEDYISDYDLSQLKFKEHINECLADVIDLLTASEYVDLARLIEKTVPCTKPSTFILTKKYKVVAGPETSNGKWPDPYGNGFFIDSKYLLSDLADMVKEKLIKTIKSDNDQERLHSATNELMDLLKGMIAEKDIKDHAMQILGKVRNRDNKYVFEYLNTGGFSPGMNGLHQTCTSFLHNFYDMDV